MANSRHLSIFQIFPIFFLHFYFIQKQCHVPPWQLDVSLFLNKSEHLSIQRTLIYLHIKWQMYRNRTDWKENVKSNKTNRKKPNNMIAILFVGRKKRYIWCIGNFKMKKYNINNAYINMIWTSVFERWKKCPYTLVLLEHRCTFNGHTMILVIQSKHDIDGFVSFFDCTQCIYACMHWPIRLLIWRTLSIHVHHWRVDNYWWFKTFTTQMKWNDHQWNTAK